MDTTTLDCVVTSSGEARRRRPAGVRRIDRVAVAGSLLVVVGCAAPAGGSGGGTTSGERLGAKYGACADPDAETSVDPRDFLVAATDWRLITRVRRAEQEPAGDVHTRPATVVTSTGEQVDVRIHDSYWPGIDWALANDAKVWFGAADPTTYQAGTVGIVLVATRSGDVFFPGDCQDQLLNEPLHEAIGAHADAVLASVPTLGDEQARAALGLSESETPSPVPPGVSDS